MGKQITFYMSENIQTSFVEYLQQNKFIFLDHNAQVAELPFSTNVYSLLWIESQYFKEGICIKKPDTFITDYQMLNRWIKKHVPYQEIRKENFLIKE